MQFNVAQLLKEPLGSERAYTLSDETLVLEQGQEAPVQGQVKATRTDKGIWVHGKVQSTLPVQCSRCLKTFKEKLSFVLDEEYLQKVDLTNGAVRPVEETDTDFFRLDERHTLDLREAIRQYIITNLPMNPVCKQTCKGLCAQCGTDLNRRQCTCSEERVDPRWAALRDLLPKGRKTTDSKTSARNSARVKVKR